MKRLIWMGVAAVAVGSLTAPLWPAHGAPPPRATRSCHGARPAAVADTAALSRGTAIAGADHGTIAVVVGSVAEHVAAPDRSRGEVRHIATRPGVGTAYVRDRAGGDVVVAVTGHGLRRFPTEHEALHPSWSASGDLVWAEGANLRIVRPNASFAATIRGPVARGLAFSPVFTPGGSIVVGVAAAPSAMVPEDEYLSDLWRYEPGARAWTKLTHFHAGSDAWTIVRTPVVMQDGSIEFVRVHGRASQDQTLVFELWELRRGSARRLRTLPEEMYLAGSDGAARVWNLRDGDSSTWRIERERADGTLEDAGCGAVMVDPLDRPDPDARPGTKLATLSPASSGDDPAASGEATAVDAILVGDFSSAEEAGDVAERVQAELGSVATVTDASQEPAIVRPGVWAVLMPLPPGTDGIGALARFRSEMPEFSGWSWLVSV